MSGKKLSIWWNIVVENAGRLFAWNFQYAIILLGFVLSCDAFISLNSYVFIIISFIFGSILGVTILVYTKKIVSVVQYDKKKPSFFLYSEGKEYLVTGLIFGLVISVFYWLVLLPSYYTMKSGHINLIIIICAMISLLLFYSFEFFVERELILKEKKVFEKVINGFIKNIASALIVAIIMTIWTGIYLLNMYTAIGLTIFGLPALLKTLIVYLLFGDKKEDQNGLTE